MVETIPDFKFIFENIKNDIKSTRFKIIENANIELLDLYLRLGKLIDENSKYGSNIVNELSIELKLEFPNMKGLSSRNLLRMRVFYKEYKNIENLPVPMANLPWTHNYTLIEKVKEYTENYESLSSKYFFKHIINNNTIESTEICFVTDTLHCMKFNDSQNSAALLESQGAWFTNNGGVCSLGNESARCIYRDDNSTSVQVNENGTIIISDAYVACEFYEDSSAGCVKLQ